MCDILRKKSPPRRARVQHQRVWFRGGRLRKSERENYRQTESLLGQHLPVSSAAFTRNLSPYKPLLQHTAGRNRTSGPATRKQTHGNNSGKRASRRHPNRYNELLSRLHEPYHAFSLKFLKQFTRKPFVCTETGLIRDMSKEINLINRTVLTGATYPRKIITVAPEDLDEPAEPFKPLIPESQWVFETPDKQRIRQMKELKFQEDRPELQPAVLQTCKRVKSIYQLNQKVQDYLNVNQFIGRDVPINLNYLEPVCTVAQNDEMIQSPVMDNQFLQQVSEQSIIFDDQNEDMGNANKRKREDDKENSLNWYEKEMKILATCRPAKPQEKILRRTLLQRKSLSFQGDTPTASCSRFRYRYRSMDGVESGLSPLEPAAELALIDSEFYPSDSTLANNASASPQLSAMLDENINLNSSLELPPPMFYPRKNFD